MSVVAAKVYEDKIVLASDSILCYGDTKVTKNFSKLLKINDIIIGAVGSAQEASIMQHFIQTHEPRSTAVKDILDYFIEFSKWKNDNTGLEKTIDNEYLMAFRGHLYNISGLFINEIKDFFAIGAGMDYALTALYLNHSPEQAVKVACELSCWVAEPIIQYEMLKEEEEKK